MAVLGNNTYSYRATGENWGNLPEGWHLREATSVDVDKEGHVYVFNRGNHPVIVFDAEGNVLRSWGEGIFTNPHGITASPDGSIWCVDNSDHSIRKFTPEGKLLSTLSEPHMQSPPMSGRPFNGPTRVAIDPRNGEILVADGYGNARVHRFSPDGKRLLLSWGEPGTDPGCFNIVHDIGVDRDGLIYIADRENRRIQVFSPRGRFEARWTDFSRAAAVHVSRGENQLVFVGEYFGGGIEAYHQAMHLGPRISILDTEGRLLARLGEQSFGEEPGRFFAPHSVATDPKGNVFVAEVSYTEFGRHMNPPRELRSLQKLVPRHSISPPQRR
jgi:DNA-binding beta-propeller fold protein YncE